MAMGDYARISKCLVRALFTLLWVYSLSSCGIWGSGTYKKVSCDFDYSIREEDKTLNLSEYQLGKDYESDFYIIRVSNMSDYAYTKYIHDKKTGIEKILSYDAEGKIRMANFEYSEADICPQYDFDKHGNVTDSINTDAGYTICWAQAMAIGKAHAGHKMHKTKPNLILTKEDEEIIRWQFFYTNKKEERKRVIIDGQTGRILEERRVVVICSN